MRLADDHIAICLGAETIYLRPTLRAAFVLHKAYGDFQTLSRRIAECRVETIGNVIRLAAGEDALEAYFEFIGKSALGLAVVLMELQEPLLEFVLILSGAKHPDKATAPTSQPISFEEYHTRLFRIGTGWLGWSPDQTWDATPAEIIEAHKGRLEMMKAIFGSGNDDKQESEGMSPTLCHRLNALGEPRHRDQ